MLKTAKTETVVITHHAPHADSLPSRFGDDILSPAYASDLSELIEAGRPALWIHGHVHESCDYQIGSTRILCNPRGYSDENGSFDLGLVVEI